MRNPTPKNHSAVKGQTLGLRRRLRVVPLSLSPSFRDAKENRESKVAARNPGGEERAKGGTTA